MKNMSQKKDPYLVEKTSRNELSGMAATDMTGLIPGAPQTSSQLEAYKALYPFLPEQDTKKPGQQ